MCLEYHIGNCLGPCVGKQTESEYAESIAAIRHVLKGNLGIVKTTLKASMAEAAADLRFEEAERLKLKLEAVSKFQAKSTVVHPTVSDVEVYGLVSDAKSAFVHFMRIHNGAVVQGQTLEFRRRLDEPDDEVLAAAIPRFGTGSTSQAEPCWPKWRWTLWGRNVWCHSGGQEEAARHGVAQRPVRLA